MLFQTLLKIIIDPRIHQTTDNYEQAMGSHVLRERSYCLVPGIWSGRTCFVWRMSWRIMEWNDSTLSWVLII